MLSSYIRHASTLFLVQRHSLNRFTTIFQSIRHFANQTNDLKMDKFIAIGQMRSTNDKAANRQQVQQIVESAAQQKACVRKSLNKFQSIQSFD